MLNVNEDFLKKWDIQSNELSLLYFFTFNKSETQTILSLLSKQLLKKTSIQEVVKTGNKYALTEKGKEIIKALFKQNHALTKEDIVNLAQELKEIFPKGKKEGTNIYWSEGNILIVKRLEKFFEKYGNTYQYKDIIDAAKRYVNSYSNNHTTMRVLKYFIFKRDDNGETSDLLNYLENKDDPSFNQDWTTKLV